MKTMSILQGVTAASLWMLAGCAPTSQDESAGSIGTARLTVVDDAHAAGSARVVAREAATGALIQQIDIELEGRTAVDVTLRPGNYVFDVQAFSDKGAASLLCVRSAKVAVDALVMATVDIKVVAGAGGKFDLGISGTGVHGSAGGNATAGGSATVGAGATAGAGVTVGGGAAGSAGTSGGPCGACGGMSGGGGGTGGSTGVSAGGTVSAGGSVTVSAPVVSGCDVLFGVAKVKVTVKAAASAGGALTFVWSGAGFQGSVVGGASAEIDVAAILASASKTTTILVQSADGVVARVQVCFDVVSHLLGALDLAGTVKTTITAAASLAASATACVDAHLKCTAGCDATLKAGLCSVEAHAACMVDCAVKLSGCCQSQGS
jgi:hypothetical protein